VREMATDCYIQLSKLTLFRSAQHMQFVSTVCLSSFFPIMFLEFQAVGCMGESGGAFSYENCKTIIMSAHSVGMHLVFSLGFLVFFMPFAEKGERATASERSCVHQPSAAESFVLRKAERSGEGGFRGSPPTQF